MSLLLTLESANLIEGQAIPNQASYRDQFRRLQNKITGLDVNAAQFDAVESDLFRERAIIEEFINRAYDWPTRKVLKQLMAAKEKTSFLETGCTWP